LPTKGRDEQPPSSSNPPSASKEPAQPGSLVDARREAFRQARRNEAAAPRRPIRPERER